MPSCAPLRPPFRPILHHNPVTRRADDTYARKQHVRPPSTKTFQDEVNHGNKSGTHGAADKVVLKGLSVKEDSGRTMNVRML